MYGFQYKNLRSIHQQSNQPSISLSYRHDFQTKYKTNHVKTKVKVKLEIDFPCFFKCEIRCKVIEFQTYSPFLPNWVHGQNKAIL